MELCRPVRLFFFDTKILHNDVEWFCYYINCSVPIPVRIFKDVTKFDMCRLQQGLPMKEQNH